MNERYDAAIIGAGADGLAAATLLARGGLRVVVLERNPMPGGRLVTRQFQRGFYASPFADDLPPIPAGLFWRLDLARLGARGASTTGDFAIWPDRIVSCASPAAARLLAEAARRRETALAQARLIAPPASPGWNPFARERTPWPDEDWTRRSLSELAAEHVADADEAAALVAASLAGRAADPLAPGSALHLLAPAQGGAIWRGGMGALGQVLAEAARAAGAEIACGRDVTDIRCIKGRAAALVLADGGEIAARAVISTLDLKRTFLSLFAWNELPKPAVKQIGAFRIAGSTARILYALSGLPRPAATEIPADFFRGAVHLPLDLTQQIAALAAWRGGVIAQRLPVSLRFDSATDPGLAPAGAAVMTATIGCVPHTLFDGAWSREKRATFGARVLASIEAVFPGIAASVVGAELFAPPDFEDALGVTAGDLQGGEIAPDQMFGWRPWSDRKSPYTPVEGLYLAGPSSAAAPLGGCAAGAIAADAVAADLGAGRLP